MAKTSHSRRIPRESLYEAPGRLGLRGGSYILRSFLVAALAICGAAFPLPLAVADPGDVDAPDSRESALLLSPGLISGNLFATDPADWYALDVPQSSYAFIVLDVIEPNLPPTLIAVDENGAAVGYDELWWGSSIGANVLPPASGTLRIGVLPSPWGSQRYNYTLETRLLDRPEVAVEDLQVTPQPLSPTDTMSGTRRLVTFNVTNAGPAAASTNVAVTVMTPNDGRSTTLLSAPRSLVAGETAEFSIDWDTLVTGTVGDAIITVSAPTYFNIGIRETATVRTYAIVSGIGFGFTVGAGYQQQCVNQFPAWSCTDWTIRPGSARINHGDNLVVVGDSASVDVGLGGAVICASAPFVGMCQPLPPTGPPGLGWQQVCVTQVGWACTDWIVTPDHSQVNHGVGGIPFVGRISEVSVWANTAPAPNAGLCVGVPLVGVCRGLP